MTSAPFRIPAALEATGTLTTPAQAIKGQRYTCPACGDVLVFRACTTRTPHFAHRPASHCNIETVTHQIAKLLVQRAVQDWHTGRAPAPQLVRCCSVCRTPTEQALAVSAPNIDSAFLEVRLVNGYVVDVGLGCAGQIVAAVEIRVTHAVDAAKARQLAVPFIELDGERLLATPQYWYSLQDTFPSSICAACQHAYTRFQQVVAQIASETEVALPTSYYRYAPTECWRCHRGILVFAWTEAHKNLFPDAEPSGRDRPHTIQLVRSETARTAYWGNTCPACHALQGAFFLHMKPDGPFFGFDCGADTADSFQHDLMILASHLYADAEQPGPDQVWRPVLSPASAPTDSRPSPSTGGAPASRSAPSTGTRKLCPCGAELERWHIRPTYGSLRVEPCLAQSCPNEHLWAATIADVWCKIGHQTTGASHNVQDKMGTVLVRGTCTQLVNEI